MATDIYKPQSTVHTLMQCQSCFHNSDRPNCPPVKWKQRVYFLSVAREEDVMCVSVTLEEQTEGWLILFWHLYPSYGLCVRVLCGKSSHIAYSGNELRKYKADVISSISEWKKRKLQIPVWKLTHSSCACGQPACRTGLELFWAGVQTLRNYHWAWFSNVTELLWESCFTWWSSRPPRGLPSCRPATPADDIKSSIPVCLLTCWDKELQCLLSVWNSAVSFLLHS